MSAAFKPEQVDGELLLRVERATGILRSMLPTLSSYASTMIGRSIPVEVGPRTQTNIDRVQIRPPLALADLGPHAAAVCGRRDELGILTCSTCAGMESVLVRLRHEIAHHVWGSFDDHLFPTRASRSTLDEALRDLAKPEEALGRVLEDVRIDRAACDADPQGAGAHYAFHVAHLARSEDPSAPPFADAPLSTRFVSALLTVGVGSDCAEFVGADAMETLEDPVVQGLIGDDFEITEIPQLAMKLYDRLIELGVFEEPPEAPSTPEESPNDNNSDTGAEPGEDDQSPSDPSEARGSGGPSETKDPGASEGTDSGQPADASDQSGHEPDSDAPATDGADDPADGDDAAAPEGDSGDGAGADDPAPAQGAEGRAQDVASGAEQFYGEGHIECCSPKDAGPREDSQPSEKDIEAAVNAMLEHTDLLGAVSGSVGRIEIYPPGEGPLLRRQPRSEAQSDDHVLGGLVGQARRVFSDNRAAKRTKGAPRGRVEPTLLGRRAWNPEDNRVFGSRTRANAPSYSVLIGMDDSYSTELIGVVNLIRNCADAMAQLCSRTGVEFGIYAHTTGEITRRDEPTDMAIYNLKDWAEQWTPRVRGRLGRLAAGNTNLDGSTLRLYRRLLSQRRSDRKILLYFTDGEIPGTGGEAEAAIMREEVAACRRAGITLLGVGIRTRSPEDFGIPTVSLDSAQDIGHVLEFLAKEFGV